MENFLNSNSRLYKRVEIPYKTKKKFICIGCYKKSWYVSGTIPDFDINVWVKKVIQKRQLKDFTASYLKGLIGTPVFKYSRKINLQYITSVFIHAKCCFNTLAHFKGVEFVQQSMFNQFRECILDNKNWEMVLVQINEIPEYVVSWAKTKINAQEHAVIIYVANNSVMAFSMLYGNSWALFKLGTDYLGKVFTYAVICDFENAKEIWYENGLF